MGGFGRAGPRRYAHRRRPSRRQARSKAVAETPSACAACARERSLSRCRIAGVTTTGRRRTPSRCRIAALGDRRGSDRLATDMWEKLGGAVEWWHRCRSRLMQVLGLGRGISGRVQRGMVGIALVVVDRAPCGGL